MHIYLQEYVGASAKILDASPSNGIDFKESQSVSIADDSLMVEIEGIHSVITGNNTYYTPKCLKESIPYWTSPYEKPLIMHHKEEDGKIVGRVKAVKYLEHSESSKTPALEFIINVGDEEGVKGVKNGTLLTTSIGATITDVECSICGVNFNKEGFCEHKKGAIYDGKKCYWIVNSMIPKEISYVIVPSDMYSCTTRVYDLKNNLNTEVKESMNDLFKELMEQHGIAPSNIALKEEEEKSEVDIVEEPKAPEEPIEPKEPVEDVKDPEGPKAPEEDAKDPEAKEDTENPVDPEAKEDEKTEETKKTEEEKTDDLTAELEKLKVKLEVLEKEKNEAVASLTKITNDLAAEKESHNKTSVELKEYKEKNKIELVEKIASFRKRLNLTESKSEDLLKLDEKVLIAQKESLFEIVNMKGNTSNSVAGIALIESNIAVDDEKDNTNTKIDGIPVKESQSTGNIDLQDELFKIFSNRF